MEITQKNKFIVTHKKDEFYEKDKELFLRVMPNNKVAQELRIENKWNRHILHGKILMVLLDKVSEEEILENRTAEVEEETEMAVVVDYGKLMKLTQLFVVAGIIITPDVEKVIFELVNASDKEVQAKIAELAPEYQFVSTEEGAETEEKTTAPETTETENEAATEQGDSETTETEETTTVTDVETVETTEETTDVENTETVIESTEPAPEAIAPAEKKSGASKKSSQK